MNSANESRVAVVDIGSNSIRLVVYQSLSRSPLVLFNEKVLCGLGRGIASTGRLNEDGVEMALVNLVRFRTLADAMSVREVHVVATAAVREAANGHAFIQEVERRTGFTVRVLSGNEEAVLGAEGLLASIPEADGMLGDLGGGSLELVDLSGGRIGLQTTLPVGPLRLVDVSDGQIRRGRTVVDKALDGVPWLDRLSGRSFYAIGGAWRSIARLLMDHEHYPLHIIHHYTVPTERAVDFLSLLTRMSKEQLKSLPNISRRRLDTIPWAALILERLFSRAMPARLVFSASGLREGVLFDRLSEDARRDDPLLVACAGIAGDRRFELSHDELFAFLAPLIEGQGSKMERLTGAACLLSDIAWAEHPDYRAEQAYWRVLRLPIVGISHQERAFLALAMTARYGAGADDLIDRAATSLLDQNWSRLAHQIGLALRLAYTISGGAPGVLRQSRLKLREGILNLYLPTDGSVVPGDAVARRLDALARSLGFLSSLDGRNGPQDG